jgi:hypothetical protein
MKDEAVPELQHPTGVLAKAVDAQAKDGARADGI